MDEPDPMTEVHSGKARLNKRYYWDRVRFFFGGKKKFGNKPCRKDYLIYPPSPATEQAELTEAPVEDVSVPHEAANMPFDAATESERAE